MRIQAIGWLLACALLWMTQPVAAQGVLSGLGRLALGDASLGDAHIPIARRVAQARSLGHLGDERAAVSVLTTALAQRPAAALRDAILKSLSERRSALAVPELLRGLRTHIGGAPLIFDALTAIGGAGVIGALTEMLQTGERAQRALALRALSRVAPEQAAPLVLRWMNDRDRAVRRAGFEVAVATPNALWSAGLAQALIDGSAPIDPATITWSLARVADGAGLDTLLSVGSNGLAAHSAVAIVACLRAYGAAIEPEQRRRAEVMLRNEPNAAAALAWLATPASQDPHPVSTECVTTKATRIELRRALRTHGPETAAARAAAATQLACPADLGAHIPLIAALDDPEPTVRRAVIAALAVLGRREARAALLRRSAVEPDLQLAMLAEAGARGESVAASDPWESARSLLPRAADPSVDRGAPALAR